MAMQPPSTTGEQKQGGMKELFQQAGFMTTLAAKKRAKEMGERVLNPAWVDAWLYG
jgi:hypothetical protein